MAAVYPRRVVPLPTAAPRQVYRAASWASAGLAFLAAVLTFGFGLAALTGPAPVPDERVTTGPRPTGAPGDVLAADQSVVSGLITKLVGTKVEAPPLVLPLTLTVAVRGGGTKAEFSGGTVGGKEASVSWDGGRPLPLRGQGSIDLNGPTNVELTPAGASWSLDGASRLLTPGSYTLAAGVAVSPVDGGLGTPRESARLDVAPGGVVSFLTEGDVRTTTPPAPITLGGPGQLVLEGTLDLRTRDGMRQATKVTFGPGEFELVLQPQPDGYRLERALLQGPMVVDG